ncbi:glycoside hydrolase family 2 protein [Sphingobacterium spiritivorum]|uniref:glycoside hydrolase family 2 protein n=1 Tax=Sphingobacterium spiritivorum TaxID=258 RepID=UPI003DA432AF
MWHFKLGDPIDQPFAENYNVNTWDVVSLPHTHTLFNADLKGFSDYGRNIGWYRRAINVPLAWKGKKVFLEIQGAMQTTQLWVNGKPAGSYSVSGYDSYHYDLTPYLKSGKNILALRVDNTVNPDCPPDAVKTDFIQFGGLYRDVSLVVTDPVHITFPWESKNAGIRITTPKISEKEAVVKVDLGIRNESKTSGNFTLIAKIRDQKGKLIAVARDTKTVAAGKDALFTATTTAIADPRLWSPEHPHLYRVETIISAGKKELDRKITAFGMRWFEFNPTTGFWLNGKHVKLVGANRHQTWPFIGNAVPNSLHRRDAEQLKEMGLNWVRLSHYPHDPDFLDALDELGLIALEEGPTWMNKGNEKWMQNLEKSFRSMIRRDRNHPAIMVWNSCINHGGANPMLVNAALEEDSTRYRGQSNVPCPMDFSHETISGNGALTIEHTGHTFPTSRGDRATPYQPPIGDWEYKQYTTNREYDLARRHYEHTNAAYLKQDNSGLAVWCMYDYNTFHNSYEGIARHGVFDLFRLPKYSYWWHKAELTAEPMAYIIRIDSTQVCVFSNCEQIKLYGANGGALKLLATQSPDTDFVLRHPPFHFKVESTMSTVKVEGLRNDKVVATATWRRPEKPFALKIETDREVIKADGSDLTRVIVTAVDEHGTAVDDAIMPVHFTINGMAQLVGENNTPLRAGKMITLVQAGFVADRTIVVEASAEGLRSGKVKIRSERDPNMPKNPIAKQPTRRKDVSPPAVTAKLKAAEDWFVFKKKIDVPLNTWVESEPIMLPAGLRNYDIQITGGEYKIYTGPWQSARGTGKPGDAIFVRLKSADQSKQRKEVQIQIGDKVKSFEVTTR